MPNVRERARATLWDGAEQQWQQCDRTTMFKQEVPQKKAAEEASFAKEGEDGTLHSTLPPAESSALDLQIVSVDTYPQQQTEDRQLHLW